MNGWKHFLNDWEAEVVGLVRGVSSYLRSPMEAVVAARGSLRVADPFSDEGDLAGQLGVSKDSSLLAFYREVNGWIQLGFDVEETVVLPAKDLYRLVDGDLELCQQIAETHPEINESEYETLSERRYVRPSALDLTYSLSARYSSGHYLFIPDRRGEGLYFIDRPSAPPSCFGSFEKLMQSERCRCVENLRGDLQDRSS